jgi:hypothetical protein
MSDVIANATATEQTGSAEQTIAAMIAANKRNIPQPSGSNPPPAGQEETVVDSPEAALEAEPENSATETTDTVEPENTEEATDGVTDTVNFLEFAEQNPDMMWRIPNKDAEGGFVEIPVSRAAAILGQGSAIHENARKLKVERADFEEYEANRRKELDGLQIGLELTIQPQLQTAADELVTLQQYNQQWKQILDNAQDEVQRSEAEAAIRQNSQLIQEKSQFIQATRPKVDQFYQQRTAFVQEQLENARKNFSDAELKNKASYSELREKLSKDWKGANGSFVPGVPNIDLVSSDEYLLGLIRDGMKFRDGPKVRNAGGSLAAANQPKAKAKTSSDTKVEDLQKRSASGDKKATQDLLATFLASQKRRPR